MNPDPEFKHSNLLTVSIFSVIIFTACHFNTANKSVIADEVKLPTVTVSAPSDTVDSNADTVSKNTIYLTFDDGPNRGTENVLNAINKEQLPITMFLIGQHVYGSEKQKEMLDSIRSNRLIEIANHSYTHAHNHFQKFYNTPINTIFDFQRCADSLQLAAKIIRTPGRNIWRLGNINSTDEKHCIAAADSLAGYGYKVVGWDVEWRFNNKLRLEKTSDQLVSQIETMFSKDQMKIPRHLVLLMHDQVFTDSANAAELTTFLTKLKSSGNYRFEMISKYPGLKN